jgi:hypothetical protein
VGEYSSPYLSKNPGIEAKGKTDNRLHWAHRNTPAARTT